jgi:multidrug efflux pump subunit AcrA (membrane-fusion protein)
MTALFASIWPYIISGVLAGAAILFGWFKTKQAQTNVAQTKATALSDVDKANANAQVAIDNLNARKTADVQADADASKTAATAAQERTNVENAQAALSDDAAREQLIGLLHGSATGNPGTGKGSAGTDPGRG